MASEALATGIRMREYCNENPNMSHTQKDVEMWDIAMRPGDEAVTHVDLEQLIFNKATMRATSRAQRCLKC